MTRGKSPPVRMLAFAAMFILLAVGGASIVRAESWLDDTAFHLPPGTADGWIPVTTTGTVAVEIAPGASAISEPVRLTLVDLGTAVTTETLDTYDPGTTFSWSAGAVRPGAHNLIVRLPSSGKIAWTQWQGYAPPYLPADASVTTEALLARYRALSLQRMSAFYDTDTTGTWLGNNPENDFHWMREDIYLATTLLDEPGSAPAQLANGILAEVAAAQDTQTTSPTYGNLYTNGTDLPVPDGAVTHFGFPLIARLLLHPPAELDPAVQADLTAAFEHGLDGVFMNESFPARFQNFALFGVAALAGGATLFNEPAYGTQARARMQLIYDTLIPPGGPAEYNSPIYTGASLWSLKMLPSLTTDTLLLDQARVLSSRLFLDVAAYYHPRLRQMTGPYSRTQLDGLYGGAGLTGFMLAQELEADGFSTSGRLGEMLAARHSLDINPAAVIGGLPTTMPPDIRDAMTTRSMPADIRQSTYYADTAARITEDFALGTAEATFDIIGPEGFVLQVFEDSAPGLMSPTFARVGTADAEVPSAASGVGYDIHALQAGGLAVVFADRTLPAGSAAAQRALFSLVSDERFAQWQDLRIDGAPIALPAALTTGSVVTARRAGAYLAVIPAWASAAGPVASVGTVARADGRLALTLHSVDAATTQAMAGVRVEAGFGVYAAGADEWPDYNSFVSAVISSASLAVAEGATTRGVEFDLDRSIGFVFDRAGGTFLSRTFDGAPPGGWLLDCSFARQTAGTTLTLRDFSASGLNPNSWVVYPEGANHVAITNPGDTTANITTPWSVATLQVEPYSTLQINRPAPAAVTEWRQHSQ